MSGAGTHNQFRKLRDAIDADGNKIFAWEDAAPADSVSGYAIDCLWFDRANKVGYLNDGTTASSQWTKIALEGGSYSFTDLDAVKFTSGDGTNEIEILEKGILRGREEGMGWDDLRVAISSTNRGALRAPTFTKFTDDGAGSTGIWLYQFDKNTEEEVHFEVQMPHDWKEGTDIHAHVHWCPVANGGVGAKVSWGLEFAWKNITDVFGTSQFVFGNTPAHSGDLIAKRHYITELRSDGTETGDQIIGTGKTLSSMLMCRFFRDATGALATDDYDDEAAVLEIDFHYQRDSFGSDQEYTKTP